MNEAIIERIGRDPRYASLVARRSRFGWIMSAAMFAAFVGFIMLVAFDKTWLSQPIGEGVTSVGIPVGLGLIFFAIVLTGLYVRRANTRYDDEMAAILRDAGQ